MHQSKILSDSRNRLRQTSTLPTGGAAHFMVKLKSHARWSEALRSTVALWLFVLLIFLPMILARHQGEPWTGVALDCSTVILSMGFAMIMFLASKATIDMPPLVRLPLRAAAVIVAAAANTTFDLMFQAWIADHVAAAWHSLPADFGRAYSSTLNYVLVYGVNMVLFHVNYARRAAISQERQLVEATQAAHQAQLTALRYQLNPHFLFNSLNSISALIVTGRNKDAEAMTDKLSSFLRSSLNADPSALIPLEEEFALTEEYLEIESVRFGERLDIDVQCAPDACRALVPSFLVQPLVENAVKHGVAKSREALTIEIHAAIEGRALTITVANGIPVETTGLSDLRGMMGAGVGLANVRRRLEAVYGPRATFTAERQDGRFVATIRVPEMKQVN
jgi:hypothetical protein